MISASGPAPPRRPTKGARSSRSISAWLRSLRVGGATLSASTNKDTPTPKLGNVTGAALAAMNAAEVLVDQGHLERAGEALIEVQRVLGAAGYAAALSYAQLLGAVVALRRDDLATRQFPPSNDCGSEFREGSMKLYALESELRLAEADCAAGRLDDAATRDRYPSDGRVRAAVETRGDRCVRNRLLGRVALMTDPATGAAHLLDAVATCREHDLRYELAVTLRARRRDRSRFEPARRSEAVQIFDELGVIESGRLVGFVSALDRTHPVDVSVTMTVVPPPPGAPLRAMSPRADAPSNSISTTVGVGARSSITVKPASGNDVR